MPAVGSTMDGVEQLVEQVLADVPAVLREMCDRNGILDGLQQLGACTVPLLRELMETDYADVKAAIGAAAKPAFVAMLKKALIDAASAKAADPATPAAGSAFHTPGSAHAGAPRALSRAPLHRFARGFGMCIRGSIACSERHAKIPLKTALYRPIAMLIAIPRVLARCMSDPLCRISRAPVHRFARGFGMCIRGPIACSERHAKILLKTALYRPIAMLIAIPRVHARCRSDPLCRISRAPLHRFARSLLQIRALLRCQGW